MKWEDILKKKKNRREEPKRNYGFSNYSAQAERAAKEREKLSNDPEMKQNIKRKRIEKQIKTIKEYVDELHPSNDMSRLIKRYSEDQKKNPGIRNYHRAKNELLKSVKAYFKHLSYLMFLQDLLRDDKEFDKATTGESFADVFWENSPIKVSAMEKTNPIFNTEEKTVDNYWGRKGDLRYEEDKFEKQLKSSIHGSYQCRECGLEVTGDEKKEECERCGEDNFSVIESGL